ncbi:hypothetical protein [Desulfuromonas sp. TF]|uniref:hypothetical protein n=1 Tax=Desulfuromonas sp. TF TaxID=1232410 RepID=UPI0004870CD7|nr:hypothetical protein [Desulfuromonas sp. TF]
MEVFYLRAAERLLIVIAGLICIILGHSLFRLSYPNSKKAEGELSYKGAGFEVTLKNVWPGVFFASFGMIVLVTSVVIQLKMPNIGDSPQQLGGSYQTGGLPPEDSQLRAKKAISVIGEFLAFEGVHELSSEFRYKAILTQLGNAQISLIDVAYGKGSYDKFLEITSMAKSSTEFAKVSEKDKQLYEDLRTVLQH